MIVLELFGGLVYLLMAGDLLVRGAVALAKETHVSPMVVGLTVVAFGTSAPELCVALGAVFHGAPGIAIGNVVGSNIANVLLVLGLPALVYPTLCEEEYLTRDCLVVLAATLLFVAFCFLGPLGRLQGAILVVLLLISLAASARRGGARPELEAAANVELERVLGLPTRTRMIVLFVVLGGIGLPLGAHLLVEGAVGVAQWLGVSDHAIALTLIAVGTSLPELATTLIAALHRHSEVALGNVLGSNLFNLLAIMGLTALVAPGPIPVPPGFLSFDLLVMLAATLLLAAIAWRRVAIGRGLGVALLTGYVLYVALVFRVPAPAVS